MPRERILVIEDDAEIQDLVRYNLEKQGYRVEVAGSGEEGIRRAQAEAPDLIVLDLMLPAMDGVEVIAHLKRDVATQVVPVVILTAKSDETDVVAGLEIGADDYITKPFSPRVLVARIRVILRRNAAGPVAPTSTIRILEMTIRPDQHEVLVGGNEVRLTATEFRVLHVLAQRPETVFTRRQIADTIHSSDCIVTERSVDVQITNLRRKLGPAGHYIETIRGVGYRLKGSY